MGVVFLTSNMMRKGLILLGTMILVFVLAACGSNNATNNKTNNGGKTNEKPADTPAPVADLSGEIIIDGSSTVYPISQAVAEEFMAVNPGVNVTVNFSGSGNGAKKLIAKEIDIADMSRKFKDKEIEDLKAAGEDLVEMPVAYDGITVVINNDNDWAKEMTAAELKLIWNTGSTVKKWSDIRADWPKEPINLYGPGTASGTFEYFTEAINGEAKVSREDFTPSEDDNVLVSGVANDKYALGYFGYSYFIENESKLQAVAIQAEGATEFIGPSTKTIESGTYAPLSRPIFIYPMVSELSRPEVKEFIKFYMSAKGKELAEEVGYVGLPQNMYDENLKHVQ
jgi:phosphate transport system substrate-binding protein